jgi:hypothetical protein
LGQVHAIIAERHLICDKGVLTSGLMVSGSAMLDANRSPLGGAGGGREVGFTLERKTGNHERQARNFTKIKEFWIFMLSSIR